MSAAMPDEGKVHYFSQELDEPEPDPRKVVEHPSTDTRNDPDMKKSSPSKKSIKQEGPFGKIITDIGSCFGLNQEEIGSLFGVSRQTIGSWKTAETIPNKEHVRKLCDMEEIAYKWRKSSLPNDQVTLNRNVYKGKNVLGLLMDTPLDIEAVLYAGRTAAYAPYSDSEKAEDAREVPAENIEDA